MEIISEESSDTHLVVSNTLDDVTAYFSGLIKSSYDSGESLAVLDFNGCFKGLSESLVDYVSLNEKPGGKNIKVFSMESPVARNTQAGQKLIAQLLSYVDKGNANLLIHEGHFVTDLWKVIKDLKCKKHVHLMHRDVELFLEA